MLLFDSKGNLVQVEITNNWKDSSTRVQPPKEDDVEAAFRRLESAQLRGEKEQRNG